MPAITSCRMKTMCGYKPTLNSTETQEAIELRSLL
jgi:hypothetical protein